jgi:hypothetical protein
MDIENRLLALFDDGHLDAVEDGITLVLAVPEKPVPNGTRAG